MSIRLLRLSDAGQVRRLMSDSGLDVPTGTDLGLGYFLDNRLMGCCHLKCGLIQGLAVDSAHQGEGIAAMLIGEMVKIARERGLDTLSVITKPDVAAQFIELGFRLIAGAPPYAVFLEFGSGGIAKTTRELERAAQGKPTPRAAVVLNANPFTLGHRHLIERASGESAWVFALAVEEDLSEFPFADRLLLIERGTAHLPNVSVLPGGRYVVSSLTFPSYFTKQQNLAKAHGSLDAALFASVIAPALGVTRRYVGTEPHSPVTHQYNQALAQRLPMEGVALIEVPRLTIGGEPVSASNVRASLKEDAFEALGALVPETTLAYLLSEDARPVIARIKGGGRSE